MGGGVRGGLTFVTKKWFLFFEGFPKQEDIERRLLIKNVHIRAKMSKIVQKMLLHAHFCSTIYVDGSQNSPLDVLYLTMKKKMANLQIHIFALFLD